MMISPFPIKDNPEIANFILDKTGLAFIIVHCSSFIIHRSSFIVRHSPFIVHHSSFRLHPS